MKRVPATDKKTGNLSNGFNHFCVPDHTGNHKISCFYITFFEKIQVAQDILYQDRDTIFSDKKCHK